MHFDARVEHGVIGMTWHDMVWLIVAGHNMALRGVKYSSMSCVGNRTRSQESDSASESKSTSKSVLGSISVAYSD